MQIRSEFEVGHIDANCVLCSPFTLHDHVCRFIYVDIGKNGRASDGGVWSDCDLRHRIDAGDIGIPEPAALPPKFDGPPIPYHIIADEAFPLKCYMMKPYARRGLDDAHLTYNYRLSRGRRIVGGCST